MQVGESIAIGMLSEENAASCPYSDPTLGVGEKEGEDIAKDELDSVQDKQDNDGGVLGRNLVEGLPGKSGTVGGPCPPPDATPCAREDTRRAGVRVSVPGTDSIPDGVYGYTVAAHHLIPGEAALEPSELKPFMTEGDSVQVQTKDGEKSKKIRKHIGYNVNGAHNGVWLPGNYYIRATNSPVKGKSWSDLGTDPWCANYVAAVTKAANGQFHDTHTQYSSAVKDLLKKMALVLSQHECEHCKPTDINPPFRIKARLYNLSAYFKTQVTAPPAAWKRPWFTSDRWRDDAFSGGSPKSSFLAVYSQAQKQTLT